MFSHFDELLTIPAAFMVSQTPLFPRNQSVSGNDEQYACCVYFYHDVLNAPQCPILRCVVGTSAHASFLFALHKNNKKEKLLGWFSAFPTFPCGFRQSPWSSNNFLLFEISCFQFWEITWVSFVSKAFSLLLKKKKNSESNDMSYRVGPQCPIFSGQINHKSEKHSLKII